jgi:hypothetical protein
MVDHLDIVIAEYHRCELRQIAARCHITANRELVHPAEVPSDAERRYLLTSLAELWMAPAVTEVEFADPLGVWSWGYPRHRSRWWPERRAVLDWGAWTVLVLISSYLLIVGG